jgi:ParB-like chromosome segregation protein Spo0J
LENEDIKIDDVYVPAKRRKTLVQETVDTLAEDILENGLHHPILVRWDGKRFVLVEGFHRLEACRTLGEETIVGLRVQARLR